MSEESCIEFRTGKKKETLVESEKEEDRIGDFPTEIERRGERRRVADGKRNRVMVFLLAPLAEDGGTEVVKYYCLWDERDGRREERKGRGQKENTRKICELVKKGRRDEERSPSVPFLGTK